MLPWAISVTQEGPNGSENKHNEDYRNDGDDDDDDDDDEEDDTL